ncbi:MAG: MBL fold metallo-hydrolase [Bacteroidota bacterium]
MTLAGYDIDTVDAGRFALDGGAMFGIVPRALWARHIEPDDQNRIPMTARCLLLRGHGRVVLVDTGMGDKHDAKFARIYGAGPFTLLDELARLGVASEDVTDVFLTHLHFDHVGGAVSRDANGGLALTFPHAQHHVQAEHWRWAQASPREGASFLSENLDPLEASGKLNLLEAGAPSPLPHTEIVTVDGHTRGQHLLLVREGDRVLFFAGDLLPTAAHVPLLWIMAYDIAPLDTLAEKERLLARAAEEGWTVVFEHDVATAAGEIGRGDRGYSVVNPRPTLA